MDRKDVFRSMPEGTEEVQEKLAKQQHCDFCHEREASWAIVNLRDMSFANSCSTCRLALALDTIKDMSERVQDAIEEARQRIFR